MRLILDALHHVPDPAAALAEAARAVRPGAPIVMVEPLSAGSVSAALKPVEDETAIRAQERGAIAAAVAAQDFRCVRDVTFRRREAFDGLDTVLERVAAIDRARDAAIRGNAAVSAAAFSDAAEGDAESRHVLVQPPRAHVLVALRAG